MAGAASRPLRKTTRRRDCTADTTAESSRENTGHSISGGHGSPEPTRARIAQAYGTLYSYWLGYSIPAQFSATVPSGIVAPGGRWLAQCPADGQPALAVADINLDSTDSDIDVALRYARPWRRSAQNGLYDDHFVSGDPRSDTHTAF